MSSNYDSECPHCGSPLKCVYGTWIDRDYDDEFDFECPQCGKMVYVLVRQLPTFELSTENFDDDGA